MKTLEQLGISPTPWNEKSWATPDDYGHDISDYNHKSICDMRLLQGKTRIPNARLIAAAPDLYEALQMYQEAFAEIRKSAWFIDANFYEIMNLNKVMTAADSALAKAAGESEDVE